MKKTSEKIDLLRTEIEVLRLELNNFNPYKHDQEYYDKMYQRYVKALKKFHIELTHEVMEKK